MRTAEQVIHDSLQEWNSDEFVELDWNTKAARRALKDLKEAGYVVVPASPTQGMRIAGHAALDSSDASEPSVGARIGFAALGDAWRAMVAEATNPAPTLPAK